MSNILEEQRLEQHITRLGFKSASQYKLWCRDNNFTTSINKSIRQFNIEYKHVISQKAVKHLQQSNQKISAKKAFDLLRQGQKISDHPIFSRISTVYFEARIDADVFLNLCQHLEKYSDLLDNKKFVYKIKKIVYHKKSWIRSFEVWKPKTHNQDKQFSSLLRHLFTKYEIPVFLDSLWDVPDQQVASSYVLDNENWFIHVAQGQNIYTAPSFIDRFPMTKKMIHTFMQSPNSYSIPAAWRLAQIKSFGGSQRLVEAFLATKLANDTKHNDFILTLIKFFCDNPMLDVAQVSPIVDYICFMKFDTQTVIENGERVVKYPEQPNFSMNGRSVEALLNQVEKWHKHLGREKKANLSWDHSKFKDFELVEGQNEHKKTYRIIELLSGEELKREGKAMSNCVSSYTQSCFNRSCSIWSMSLEAVSNVAPLLTIEVRHTNKQIVQIRGKYNRLPTQKEMLVVRQWAQKENLCVSQYIN